VGVPVDDVGNVTVIEPDPVVNINSGPFCVAVIVKVVDEGIDFTKYC
jgi:hypothetical protein